MFNPGAAVASQPIPVPVVGASRTSSDVGAMLNSTGNTPAPSTRPAAVKELAHVIGMAYRSYDDNAVLIRGGGAESWDLDSDHEARDERRIAQAQAGINPGSSSPSGVASTAILRLVKEGYGASTARHIQTLYPGLAHGAAVTPKILARLRVDLTPSNLRTSGSFSADVSARARQYIVENLACDRAAAQAEFETDLTRALYVVDGKEISRPGLPKEEALANFEAAIPDPRTREVLRHIAFQGTLGDVQIAATTSDEVFSGGYGTTSPHPSWSNHDDLKYEISRADNGDYTVVAENRRYASRTCDPHIASLDDARPLGAGSHYDVRVEVTVPASVITQGRFEEISVTSAYAIDFHPPSPAAPALATLLHNVQDDHTTLETFIANIDDLRCAVRLKIERQIGNGLLSPPRNAEDSCAQWRQIVGNAAKDIAWDRLERRTEALLYMACAMHDARRFTEQLPDSMTLIGDADHYGVDVDRFDLINEATAPFTVMQQAVMPALVDIAFGADAHEISGQFELTPQRDPATTSAETMRVLRDRFRELGLLACDQPPPRAAPAITDEPGLPRRLEDGTRVIDMGDVELIVVFDKMTDTWRVADPTGHATGDHMLFDDNTGAWVRRPPGLLGGATQATVRQLRGNGLANSLDALSSLVELEPGAAAGILLQPGVLDALAAHVAEALPYSARQQPHAALPLQVAADICRKAWRADQTLGQQIVDAWLPRESLADSPMARLLEHHSLYHVQPATDAVTLLLADLSRSEAMRRTLYDRFQAPTGRRKRLAIHLEKSPAFDHDTFRKHIRGRLAEAGVVARYRSKRTLTPEQHDDQLKRRRVPNADELRACATAVTERTHFNEQEAVQMHEAALDAAANVAKRDAEEAIKRAIVKRETEEHRYRLCMAMDQGHAASQHRRKVDNEEREQRLSADHHEGQRLAMAERAARQDRVSAAIATLGHGLDLAHRERAAIASRERERVGWLAIDNSNRSGATPAVTARALTAANPARALPQAAELPGQLTHRNDAVMLPPGSSFNRSSGRAEVPVISQGRDAVLSIPLNRERPVVFQVAMPRQAAIETPRQADTRATLVNIDNRPAGVAITVRRDGHTGRFAVPHQQGEPVRLNRDDGTVVSYTPPGRALPRNSR